jgi:protein SCO1/2
VTSRGTRGGGASRRPRRAAVWLTLATLLGAPPPALAQSGGPAPASDPLAGRFGGPFSLVAQDGRRVTDADLRGRYLLITFGYTHCPDVCPTDLAVMAQAIDALGPAGERIQPVFVTVDPGRDTQQVLADYVASFHPRLLGLGGSEAEVAAVARAYKVHRLKVLTSPGQTEDYLVDHSSLTYLMGPDGGFLTLFPTGTTAGRMAAAIRTYLR